jgi:hypothetical protein
MDYYSNRNAGCRIRQASHRGHNLLSLENARLRIVLLLDKGADIVSFIDKPTDTEFLWQCDGGLYETERRINAPSMGAGTYFDFYPGGWQEILPGGGPANYYGADVGLHGELSLRPFEFAVVKDCAEKIEVALTAKTVRFPFAVKKTIAISEGKSEVDFSEELTNEGAQELEYMWAQHPCFGKPFLEPGCTISIPAKKMLTSPGFHTGAMLFPAGFQADWPYAGKDADKIVNVQSEHSGIMGLYHFSELSEGKYSIYNKKKNIGFCLEWDKAVFPFVASYHDYNGALDYPWYGRCWQATVEIWNTPTDNYATAKKIGTIPKIKGGETVKTSFRAAVIKEK